jgi:nitric oxide reductase large subunit
MTTVFWWVSIIITLLFLIALVVFFICQWIIYFRVERTVRGQNHAAEVTKHDEGKVRI